VLGSGRVDGCNDGSSDRGGARRSVAARRRRGRSRIRRPRRRSRRCTRDGRRAGHGGRRRRGRTFTRTGRHRRAGRPDAGGGAGGRRPYAWRP